MAAPSADTYILLILIIAIGLAGIILSAWFVSAWFLSADVTVKPGTTENNSEPQIASITLGELLTAKQKIRDAVTEYMPLLVKQHSNGIILGSNGTFVDSPWKRSAEHFLNTVARPRLTPSECAAVAAAGINSIVTELIEKPVKARIQAMIKAGQTFPVAGQRSVPDGRASNALSIATRRVQVEQLPPARPGPAGANGRISRGLIIRPEPIENILAGRKTWEMRSRPVELRGTIGLVKKGSKTVVGVADIVDCLGPLSLAERLANEHRHRIPAHRWADSDTEKYKYAWVMANVRRLPNPVPYDHKGGVQFVTLDNIAIARIEHALTAGAGSTGHNPYSRHMQL